MQRWPPSSQCLLVSQSAAAPLSPPPKKTLPPGPSSVLQAGAGFFTLAAAARGFKVVAFEASPISLEALRASIALNGFGSLVTLHNASLGVTSGSWCLERRQLTAGAAAAGSQQQQQAAPAEAAAASAAAVNTSQAVSRSLGSQAAMPPPTTTDAGQRPASSPVAVAAAAAANASSVRWVGVRRGYPRLEDGGADTSPLVCERAHTRLALADVLRNTTRLGALRISAHGHEGWVLEGALPLLSGPHRPTVVYLEFAPTAMRAAGYADPLRPLRLLQRLGYLDVAHAGRVCDARWRNITDGLQAQVRVEQAARRRGGGR